MDKAQGPDDFFLGPKVSVEPSPWPSERLTIPGKYITLQSLSDEDVPSLWHNLGMPDDGSVFNYLPMLRFDNPEDFAGALQSVRRDHGMVIYAIKADADCLSPMVQYP